MLFQDLMTYKRILIRHIYTSVISWWYDLPFSHIYTYIYMYILVYTQPSSSQRKEAITHDLTHFATIYYIYSALARCGCFLKFWTRLTLPILTLLLVSSMASRKMLFRTESAKMYHPKHTQEGSSFWPYGPLAEVDLNEHHTLKKKSSWTLMVPGRRAKAAACGLVVRVATVGCFHNAS